MSVCRLSRVQQRGGTSSSYPNSHTSDTDLEFSLSTMTGVILSIIGKASRPKFGSSQTPKELLSRNQARTGGQARIVGNSFFIFGRRHWRFGLELKHTQRGT